MRIEGFYQEGGGCLVVVDGAVLALPRLERGEARHSPDGFQWGYAGSGPAELARALLVRVFPGDPTARHPAVYQAFKRDVIARLPRESFVLDGAQVEAWRATWARTDDGARVLARAQAADDLDARDL